MPYRTEAVVNSFLHKSFDDEKPIDPMKAQKLTYFAHGYYLALTDDPLVDEYFQAWKLGPIVPSLYHVLKVYRGNDIDDFLAVPNALFSRKLSVKQDEDFAKVRRFVWSTYKDTTSMDLSRLTHKVGYAWDRTLKKNPGIQGPPMLNSDILEDFRPLVKRDGGIRAHT